jgi:nucleoside-diphosphate-sugar epimerase
MTLPAQTRTVVVTGAAGFIGSHLVDQLLNDGHVVVGIDRRDPTTDKLAAVNLTDAMSHPRFTLAAADLTTDDIDTLLVGTDTVFHLAAVPGVRPSWGERFPEYLASNVLGTFRLIGACVRNGVRRVVYASSSSVYGIVRAASREHDMTMPASPYGVTKLGAEQMLLAHSRRVDAPFSVIALRYFTVYGPRQRPDMAIARMLAAGLTGRLYTVFGDGSARREFTYVSDVVDATVAAARIPLPSAVLNVGGGTAVTVTEALAIAADVVGRPIPTATTAAVRGDVPQTSADLSVASDLLQYRPKVDLRTGMRRQAEWLRGLPDDLLNTFTQTSTQEHTPCLP